MRILGPRPIPVGCGADLARVLQVCPPWQRRGPELEETDLQGDRAPGRLRARVFQEPGVS